MQDNFKLLARFIKLLEVLEYLMFSFNVNCELLFIYAFTVASYLSAVAVAFKIWILLIRLRAKLNWLNILRCMVFTNLLKACSSPPTHRHGIFRYCLFCRSHHGLCLHRSVLHGHHGLFRNRPFCRCCHGPYRNRMLCRCHHYKASHCNCPDRFKPKFYLVVQRDSEEVLCGESEAAKRKIVA